MARSDTDRSDRDPWRKPGLAIGMAMLGPVAVLFLAAAALGQGAARVAAGEEAWDKAGCFQCHGASGEGGPGGEFPAGPSLRKSRLDRADLAETISCGRPGTPMPAWLERAYTERP